MLTHAASVFLLHFLPKQVLWNRLVRDLSVGLYTFQPCFSGRSALFSLASELRGHGESQRVALVPEYVCNVVPKAFSLAGYKILTYGTNAVLEAEWDEVAKLVVETKPRVLVGASIFGSSALLFELEDPHKQAFLRSHKVQVVVDLAQDIRLRHRLPMNCSDFVHAVLSFNDKSFPGAMGGGILSERTVPRLGEMSTTLESCLLLYRMAIGRCLAPLLRLAKREPKGRLSSSNQTYEYSFCETFPYCIDKQTLAPLKLQLIMAYIGSKLIGVFDARKRILLRRGLHLNTAFSATAAYVMVKNEPFEHDVREVRSRRRKAPYGIEGNSAISLRPTDLILHNKGFADL